MARKMRKPAAGGMADGLCDCPAGLLGHRSGSVGSLVIQAISPDRDGLSQFRSPVPAINIIGTPGRCL